MKKDYRAEFSDIAGWQKFQKSVTGFLITGIMLLTLTASLVTAQTTVFYDNFNRTVVSPGGTPEMTYTTASTGAGAAAIDSNFATGTIPYLKISNGNPAGRTYVTGSLSTFSAPFNTTLGSNTGPVTWTFNIRHSRGGGTVTTLGGFAASSYGIAAVLAATNSNLLATGCNGYAVVMGAPSSGNVYNLVKFTNGLTSNTNFTTIVTGTLPTNTTPNNLRDYMSIKVTYDPVTNMWKLYERVDGLSASPAWADPTTVNESNFAGQATDNAYTSVTMSVFGYFWNYSTSAGINAYFDNFGVAVNPVVTPSLSVLPTSLSSFSYITGSGPSASQLFNVSGLNLNGNPIDINGSTDYEVSADNVTFGGTAQLTYSGSSLSSTPVYVRLKAGLAPGSFNGETLSVSGGGASAATVTCNGVVMPPPAVYTWTGATDRDWQTASNWNPERTAPQTNDILQFNSGIVDTIVNVPTQTIARLMVSGGTKATLQASAAAVLTISGESGTDLSIAGSTSELNLAGTSTITIQLNTGATGHVEGSMIISGGAHVVKATDAGSLVFATGSICLVTTGFSGNLFGTVNLNSVHFQAGSNYIQNAGSNPFGAGQPSSVVVFQTGSLYKFTAPSGNPSFSGRTYADFENDSPLTTQNLQGSSPFTCDNYTLTSGTVNWDYTGGINIKGNLSVASGAILTFGNLTKLTNLTVNGLTAQTISGTGTLTLGANSTLTVNNAAGVTMARDITAYNVAFQSGKITTGSHTLTIASTGAITGAGSGKYISGNLRMPVPAGNPSILFPVGDASAYTPVLAEFTGVTTAGALSASTTPGTHPQAATSGISATKYVNRYWSLINSTSVFGNCDVLFTFVPEDIAGAANPNLFIVKKWDAPEWSNTNIAGRTAVTTKIAGLTSFSDFLIGEEGCVNPAVYSVSGGGTYCEGGAGVSIQLSGSESGVIYQLLLDNTAYGTPLTGTGEPIVFTGLTLAGVYTVTGTNALNGCWSAMSGSAVITTSSAYPVSVSIGASANPVDAGTAVTFTASPVNGGDSPLYQWFVNGIEVSSGTSSTYEYIPANQDSIFCILTSNLLCATGNPASSGKIVMVVVTVPENLSVSGIVYNGQNQCFNAIAVIQVAEAPATFTVQPGGIVTMIAGEQILYHPGTWIKEGGYLLGRIAPGGPWCEDLPSSMNQIKAGTDIPGKVAGSPLFRVYPNPTSGEFTVELDESARGSETMISLTGMKGEMIRQLKTSGELKTTMSLAGQPSGVYVIRVIGRDATATARIIRK